MAVSSLQRNYQLLELEDGASLADVELAYRRLLRRYEAGCLPSYGLLRVKERNKLLDALKDAYEQLKRASGPVGGSGGSSGGDQDPDAPGQHHNPTHAAEDTREQEATQLATVAVGASAMRAQKAHLSRSI